MKSWVATGLTLVGMGGSLLSGGVAFAAEESHYCAVARQSEAQDWKNSMQCAMRPDPRWCTTTVDGRVYSGYADLCESPRTDIYQALCRDGVTEQGPLEFACGSELSAASFADVSDEARPLRAQCDDPETGTTPVFDIEILETTGDRLVVRMSTRE